MIMRHVSSRTGVAVVAIAVAAAPAAADEVFLRGGGRVTGVIVERTKDAVVLETAPGRVTLPMRRIEKIVESRSALKGFRDRAAALAPRDVDGWAALARWAAERDLLTQAREAWQTVLAAEPSHPEANAALGRVELEGSWVSEAEAYRARGYVEFEGRWVTPPEHEALVRERAADDASARERREADLRVREAEARAREAEARAREAEAVPAEDGGIPLWWGWGGGGGFPPPGLLPPDGPPTPEKPPGEHRPEHPRPPAGKWTTPVQTPPVTTQPTSGSPRPPSPPAAIPGPPTRAPRED
jgi:hypothetical protein